MSARTADLVRLVDELFDVYLDEDPAGRVEILDELRGLDTVRAGFGSSLAEAFVADEQEPRR